MPVPADAIHDFVREQMALGQMPGLGLSLVVDGGTHLETGYGFADVERGIPMTEHTPVVIGSTTKALTAAAVMQLAGKGLLSLDDPIRRHLPDFRLADEEAAATLTIRHALSHTGGLPATPMDGPSFLFSDDMEPDSARRIVAEMAAAEPVWRPGAGWLYANDGYVLAGRVIETVSGQTYEDYMDSNIFRPLGLSETRFPRRSEPDRGVAVAYDYGPDGAAYPSFFPHNRGSNAAGMLLSTAHDAGRWLRAVLGGGKLGETRIVAEEGLAETMKPQAELPPGPRAAAAGEAWYGLGWMVGTLDGAPLISHGGSAITMGSQYLLLPEQGAAVAVVTNSSTEATAVIAEGVLRLATGRQPARGFPRVDPSFRPDRSRWPRLAGTYASLQPQNAVTSLLPIELAGRGLLARTYPGDSRRRPGDIHFMPLDGELSFILYGRGKTGGLAQFDIDRSGVHVTLHGTPLRKIASRLHSGSVALWRER